MRAPYPTLGAIMPVPAKDDHLVNPTQARFSSLEIPGTSRKPLPRNRDQDGYRVEGNN